MNIKLLPRLIALALLLALVTSGCNQNKTSTKAASANATAPPNPKIEAIRSAGYPTTPAELNAWYAEPSADENAAPLYAEAFAALIADTNSPTYLAQNQKTLELLHRAATKKQCRFPIDLNQGMTATMPHLANFKKCAQLLSHQAAAHASKGQMDLASQSITDGLRLGRFLEQEPVLISHLVQLATHTMVANGLNNLLNTRSFSNEQLTRLQSAFADAESGVSATRAMAGERATGLSILQMPLAEQEKVLGNIDAAESAKLEAYRKSPEFSADLDFYLDRTEELVAAAALPFPKSLDAMSQWMSQVSEAKTKGYIISGAFLPAIEKSLDRSAECAARLRAGQAALAVERYRAANQNALPETLSQLSPQFLRAVPVDPFDGQPLRYKKSTPAGYVVYSVGNDRADDGGKPRPTGAKTGGDVAFTVRR